MDDLVRLADTLNLSKLRLLADAGYLDGINDMISYLDLLEEQAARIDQAARQLPSPPTGGATLIADAALDQGNYEVRIRPLWLGTEPRRCHYDDRIILSRLDKKAVTPAELEQIEERLRPGLAWFGAGFGSGWDGEPYEIGIRVPRFVASRHSSGSPTPALPRSVAVIGGHWAGSADVASLLAYAFDYDYSHVAFVASRAFSRLTHDWENASRERDRLESTRTYVEGSAIARHRVWAADVGDSDEAVKIIATSQKSPTPFVVSLRPSDDLLEWAAYVRSRWDHTNDDPVTGLNKLREARTEVDRSLQPMLYRRKGQVIDVPLPAPNSVDDSGVITDNGDAWFDMWASLAEEIIEKMHGKHGIPFNKNQALYRMRAGIRQ